MHWFKLQFWWSTEFVRTPYKSGAKFKGLGCEIENDCPNRLYFVPLTRQGRIRYGNFSTNGYQKSQKSGKERKTDEQNDLRQEDSRRQMTTNDYYTGNAGFILHSFFSILQSFYGVCFISSLQAVTLTYSACEFYHSLITITVRERGVS